MADTTPHSYDPDGTDARLVVAAQTGDGAAFAALYDRWFDRVYDVIARIARNPETAAEVAQDTFVVAYERLGSLRQPESFGGWLLRAGRNRALNRLERDRRSTTMGDDATAFEVDRQATAAVGSPAGASPVAAAAEFNEMEELVWAASVALGERDASILHLHLRHGLDGADLAEELGVSANAANQSMFRMRNRLGDAIRAWTLWHHGDPRCVELAAVLAAATVSAFGRDAVRVIGRHADDCERCDAERDARVAPAALFAGIPVLAAPVGLKEELARSLSAQGVPAAPGVEPDPVEQRTHRRAVAWLAAALVLLVGAVATMVAWPAGESDLVAHSPTTPAPTTTTTTTATTTTAPTTTVPDTTPDSIVPPPPDPTTSTTATTVTTAAPPETPPETPPPTAPQIVSIDAVRQAALGCASPSQTVFLYWSTTEAEYVLISGPGAPAGEQPGDSPPEGVLACNPNAVTYTITAIGPGGEADAAFPSVPAG